jgi:hypothetical protein
MFLTRLIIGLTSFGLGTGTALAQDMPALMLDTAPGAPIPLSVHLWAVLAVAVAWLVMLWVVGAIGSRQDADAK